MANPLSPGQQGVLSLTELTQALYQLKFQHFYAHLLQQDTWPYWERVAIVEMMRRCNPPGTMWDMPRRGIAPQVRTW